MNFFLRLCPGDAGIVLVAQILLEATVVILTAILLARWGQRWNAGARHGIYLVALLCVLACPLISWTIRSSGLTLLALPTPLPEPVRAELVIPSTEVSTTVSPPATEPSEPLLTAAVAEPATVVAEIPPSQPLHPAPSNLDLLRALGGALVAVWLLGVFLLGLRWIYGQYLATQLRRSVQPLDEAALVDLLPQVRQALGTKQLPPLATSTQLDGAVMIGLLRPLVIIPKAMLDRLPDAALVDVLVHECAHAVCRHQAVGLLQRLAAMVFWPHPLIHLLNRELARAREEVCDNYVLRRSKATRYARTLLELSQLWAPGSPQPASLGLFHCRWKLEDRIADLLDQRRKLMTSVNRRTVAILTALFLVSALPIAGLRLVQAATPECREVHRLVKDFPEKEDLSTPESAMVAFLRKEATIDIAAMNEVSWGKLEGNSEALRKFQDSLKQKPEAQREIAQSLANAEIVTVLTYRDDLAVVLIKTGTNGQEFYCAKCFGQINGIWKYLFFDVRKLGLPFESQVAVVDAFAKEQDSFWQRFVEIRNEVLNGRTPTVSDTVLIGEAQPAKAEQASPECREVHRLVKDFPEKEDLSTPESALAAWGRKLAAKDLAAVNALSWVKFDAKLSGEIEQALKNDPNAPPDYPHAVLDAEIVEVLIYQDDLAAIVTKVSSSDKPPYEWAHFGRINGQWKSLSIDLRGSHKPQTWPSVQAAADNFEGEKGKLWQRFVEIRDEVLNGRTPTVGAAERPNAAGSPKPRIILPQTPREIPADFWGLELTLDMPSLTPPAAQYTVLDYDPTPEFLASAQQLRDIRRKELFEMKDEDQKERHRNYRAMDSWDGIFQKVQADKLWLLFERPTAFSSTSPDGEKWLVTKAVNTEGKPVCWCLPLKVKKGGSIPVLLNAQNTYDLRAAYDKVMQESSSLATPEEIQKRVEAVLSRQHPEITSRETIEWGEPSTAANGEVSLRYKYLAKFSSGETKIMNQIFTFDIQGKFVSLADVAGFPRAW